MLITCCFFFFFQVAVATLRGSSDLLAVVSISALPNESVMERIPPQDVAVAIITVILAGAKELLLFLRKSTDIGFVHDVWAALTVQDNRRKGAAV